MVEATMFPRGPYSLRLTARGDTWLARLPGGGTAEAAQLTTGEVVIRAPDEPGLALARFVLAIDDDTGDFHRRFARDPLLGPAVRRLRGLRPRRKTTVAHAALRAVAGQLVQSHRARQIERAVIRECAVDPPTREALAALSPAALCRAGLAASRAVTLSRIVREIDVERLRTAPSAPALARLGRIRGVGPWSMGVVALQGLGRYDLGLVGDLGLVKLLAAVRGNWPEPEETSELLEPYAEWQGLASVFLLEGLKRGLIPGATRDRARAVRAGSPHRA